MKRLLSGVVLLPLLILFLLKGSAFQFLCFTMLLSFIGLSEFYRMALPDRRAEGWLATVLGTCLPVAFTQPGSPWLLPLLTALFLLFALLVLFRLPEIRRAAGDMALLSMGFIYLPLLLGHLVLLRSEPNGISWLFLMLVIVMSGDTAAYYGGSNLGRHKLYPRVSPNKSIEGAVCGLLGSVAGTFLARATFFPQLTPLDCLATALLLGILGQLGDLFESLLKRSFGVKDSGTIIPGHGGILDRLDSILFAAPAAWYYAHFIM